MPSRQLTNEEIRQQLFNTLNGIVKYWSDESKAQSTKEKLEGAIFSVLSMIDGCNCGLCGFKLIPNPHQDDKQYH